MLTELPAQLFIPLGVVFAALIGGVFSYLGLVLAKEAKVSEFRHESIEVLRKEFSALLSAESSIEYLAGAYDFQHSEGGDHVERAKLISPKHESVAISANLIRIRLSSNNPVHKELLAVLERKAELFGQAKYSESCKLHADFRKKAQAVLREEWKRVKAGEITFRITRRVAAVLIVVIAGSAIVLAGVPIVRAIIDPAPNDTEQTVTE